MGFSSKHGGKPTTLSIPFPKFLVLHSELPETKLSTVSPFLIAKAISGVAGTVTSVKKLSSGDLLVNTSTEAQTKNLLKCKNLSHIPITAYPHPSLNNTKGVIYCPDLTDIPETEIEENLREQNIEKVKQISIKKDGNLVKSPLFILTFTNSILPSKIHVGYLSVNVRPYVPNPLRCFRCQRFGHSGNSCRGSPACGRCGGPDHVSDHCKEDPKCLNCGEGHPSYDKKCTKWIFEKEVQRLKVLKNLSYPEARKETEKLMPPKPQNSYASIVSNGTQLSSNQPTRQTAPKIAYQDSSTQTTVTLGKTSTPKLNENFTKLTPNPLLGNKPDSPVSQHIQQQAALAAVTNLSGDPLNKPVGNLSTNPAGKRGQPDQIKVNVKVPKQNALTEGNSSEEGMEGVETEGKLKDNVKIRGRSRSRHKEITPPSSS